MSKISDDDKNAVFTSGNGPDTATLMKSRIHQQSELISMMKQRSDGMILKLTSHEETVQELEEKIMKLEDSLSAVQNDYETLRDRFDVLSYNHEEMIKLKDEYKDEVKQLTLKNQSLLDGTNKSCAATQALESDVKQLHDDLAASQTENKTLHEKSVKMESQMTDQMEILSATKDEIASLKKKLEEAEMKFKESCQVVQDTQKKLRTSEERCANLEVENGTLKESVQSLGNSFAAKTEQNMTLTEKVKKLEKEINHIRSASELMSKDAKVQMLQKKLQSVEAELQRTQQEFSVYQDFTSKQLKEERTLNEKLRHFAM